MLNFRRALIVGALTLVLAMALASVAFAHALYASSVPAANSTVGSVPSQVKALFVEGVNPQGSSLTVTGPSGARVDLNDGHVDLNVADRKTMVVSLKSGLGPGKYTVNWATVSADDGESASGSFVFTVASPAASSPAPASAAASIPAALPKSGGVPIVPIVGLGIALVASGLVMRRRAR